MEIGREILKTQTKRVRITVPKPYLLKNNGPA